MSAPDAPATPPTGLLPWDTDFFGFRIGRANVDRLTPALVQSLLSWSAAEQLRCLYLSADPSDGTTLSLAHKAGFQFVDVRLDFALGLSHPAVAPAAATPAAEVRIATAADLPACELLARTAHTDTRFFKDTRFPADRAAELYAEWIRRDFRLHRVLTSGAPGSPDSYVTCQLDPATREGRIGLIAVAPAARGRGCGGTLVRAALDFFQRSGCLSVRVATQASNLSAQRLYQAHGFRTAEASATFHRWF